MPNDERPAGALLRWAAVSGAVWIVGRCRQRAQRADEKFSDKIQWIYNAKCAAHHNPRPCADERKIAGAKTMKNNGKNNAQNNGNGRHPGARRPVVTAARRAMMLRASRRQADRVYWRDCG
jgi:hypothetical protein